jgi:autotransporter-associated beta strand protein
MKRRPVQMHILLVAVLVLSRSVLGEDVSGELENPNNQYGKDVDYRLVGQTTFGWKIGRLTGNLDLNGHDFTMETGGGNRTVFSGVISGTGSFRWNGGGNAQWQTVPSFLTGKDPNTFTGTLTVLRGTLALAKPAGVSAFAGNRLVLGGGGNQAIIRLDASKQLSDSCDVQIVGKHEGRIWTQGHSESLGTLELGSFGYINLGDGESKLRFADSSKVQWNLSKTLTIQNWTDTHEDDEVFFGTSAAGLTSQQLARIGFENPSDRTNGLYSARILANGRIIPDRRVEAVNAPFDVSDEAKEARRKVYDVPGRKLLSGKDTPLVDGTRISFFGNSITWQNVYIREIGKAIESGAGTQGFEIALFNHGINGGGVLSVRDGVEKAAYVDNKNTNGKQAPFAEVIAADMADVAVVFIGINDVWWRKTSEADFEQALRDLVNSARANKTALVLATLTVYQEKPDGTNPMDEKCDQFAEVTRKVARSSGATLVDLRSAYLAYLRNHNAELRVDGSLNYVRTGVLTYDGVHPNASGNGLLADHISRGIYEALRK